MKKEKLKEINFYIGSNNKTGEIDLNIIEAEFNKLFKGYTILNSFGYWEASKEKSILIKVLSDLNKTNLINFTQHLKRELKQYCILITINNNLNIYNI